MKKELDYFTIEGCYGGDYLAVALRSTGVHESDHAWRQAAAAT